MSPLLNRLRFANFSIFIFALVNHLEKSFCDRFTLTATWCTFNHEQTSEKGVPWVILTQTTFFVMLSWRNFTETSTSRNCFNMIVLVFYVGNVTNHSLIGQIWRIIILFLWAKRVFIFFSEVQAFIIFEFSSLLYCDMSDVIGERSSICKIFVAFWCSHNLEICFRFNPDQKIILLIQGV